MDFPSRFHFDSRLSSAQIETFDYFKLTVEENESPLQEDLLEEVKDPDILLGANYPQAMVQPGGDLENEVKIEDDSDFYGYYATPSGATGHLCESTPQEETFGFYQFAEEDRKPFDEDYHFEQVKDPDTVFDANFTGSIIPAFEDLQNEVKIEDEREDGEFQRREMLNAASLLVSDADEGAPRSLFTCLFKTCPSSHKTFRGLEEHMELHPENSDFFCDACSLCLSSKEAAMAHVRRREKNECCGCGKEFWPLSAFLKHLRCHTGEKPFVCKFCWRRFTQSSHLRTHLLNHTGEKRFFCRFCGEGFGIRQNLETHERRHTGEKPFKCSQCDFECAVKQTMSRHEKLHAEGYFSQENEFMPQELASTGEKPYFCNFCDYSSHDRSEWVAHLGIHSGHKPFSCGHCGKQFAHKRNLMAHELTHTEEPYECKECGRRFPGSCHLNEHVRQHNIRARPFRYSCEKCHVKFTRNLEKHIIRTHLPTVSLCRIMQKPPSFSCYECGIKFMRSDHLKKHMERKHSA